MATLPTGLGKGLDGLIRNTQAGTDAPGPVTLPISDISPNPRQPRRNFDAGSLDELASSIRSRGLLQPLLVRPMGLASPGKYEIVAGERRWRACRLAGLTEIPVVIRSLSDQDTLIAALIENLQREDLNPLEEALGLQSLKNEFGLNQEEMAQKIGKSRSAIANSLRLLSLPESVRLLIADGTLSPGHARVLLGIGDGKAGEYLKNLILENHLSVRETEGLAAGWKESGCFNLYLLSETPGTAAPGSGPDGASARDKEPADASPAPKSRAAKAQSAVLMDIQSRVSSLFSLPVRVTGKEDKGRISFVFNSKEELDELLRRFCFPVLGGRRDPALEGRNDSILRGNNDPALCGSDAALLDGRDDTALDGRDDTILIGRDLPALDGRDDTVLDGKDLPVLDGRTVPALDSGEKIALEGAGDAEPAETDGTEAQDAAVPPQAAPMSGRTEERTVQAADSAEEQSGLIKDRTEEPAMQAADSAEEQSDLVADRTEEPVAQAASPVEEQSDLIQDRSEERTAQAGSSLSAWERPVQNGSGEDDDRA
ncbi:MAG: ParB/RepB/Spo0J family partition protein [Desulfovibrio sp.]|nr:ParB/RepB/Spo0J family partition protein [Desulfovibrio sp.]